MPNRAPLPTVLPASARVVVAPGLGRKVPLPPLNLPPIPELPPPPEIQDADTTEEPATGTTADSDASAQQPATIKPIVPQPTAVVAVPRTPPRESAQTPPSAAPAPKPSAPVAPAAAPKPAPSVPRPASEPVLPRVPPVPPAPPVLLRPRRRQHRLRLPKRPLHLHHLPRHRLPRPHHRSQRPPRSEAGPDAQPAGRGRPGGEQMTSTAAPWPPPALNAQDLDNPTQRVVRSFQAMGCQMSLTLVSTDLAAVELAFDAGRQQIEQYEACFSRFGRE